MIKTPISVQVESLHSAQIHHSCFIGQTGSELHLWDANKLQQTLEVLISIDVQFGSIVKRGEGEDIFYIITF